jgi:hypothetical protein
MAFSVDEVVTAVVGQPMTALSCRRDSTGSCPKRCRASFGQSVAQLHPFAEKQSRAICIDEHEHVGGFNVLVVLVDEWVLTNPLHLGRQRGQ